VIRLRVAAVLASLLVAGGVFAAAPAEAATPAPGIPVAAVAGAPAYYLSLGDSLGYGYQAVKVATATGAASFNTGYTDDLSKLLALTGHRRTTVNYACPGETSSTFISGGCPWTFGGGPLHDPYSGSQLDAARSFLQNHQGQVPLITLSIGANDVLGDLTSCQASVSGCPLLGHLATLHANLDLVLTQLRGLAPTARIVVLSLYNPFAKAVPSSAALALAVDATIDATALSHGVRVADAYVPFNIVPWPGLCKLTYYCSNGDIHPTDLGYSEIAAAFFGAQL
jgi:lysophospholipase L1-like esterase